ncbi:hypothetical protein ACT7C3_09330 [Bacillus pacificus]
MIIILISLEKETLLSSVALLCYRVVNFYDLNVGILESLVIAFYLCRWAGRRRKVSNECTYVALFAFGVNNSKKIR